MMGYRSHVGVQVTCWGTGHMYRSHVGVQVTCWGAGHMLGCRSHVRVQVTWGSDNATLMRFVTGKY